ncbi:MAG TPA: VOC family protein [Reyranella sp.]|nr:VOC family protein [Reyranella sp.]
MLLNLSQIGQIALPISDVERAEAFFGGVLGLRKLYRFGDLTFFDCTGVRLLREKVKDPTELVPPGCLYFRCADIALAVAELEKRGLAFTGSQEAPRGYAQG